MVEENPVNNAIKQRTASNTLHAANCNRKLSNAMSGTPRLKSEYPPSPTTDRKKAPSRTGYNNGPPIAKSSSTEVENAPIIPLSLVDAPSQRAYVFGLYVALTAWKLYDYYGLISDETESLWLWLKWVFIDWAFFFGIPELRIPWLQWSPSTVACLFFAHVIGNWVLMFRIPIPFEAWLLGFTRMIYDRELAISERRVKPGSLLHNSSLILGKKIVHILPEG